MREFRIGRDGVIRLPAEILDGLALFPGSKFWVRVEDGRLVIEKAVDGEDPFQKAARGPDLSAMDRIRREQKEQQQRARDKFEEMMKNPPEVKPEDNPDLWR